MNAASLDGLGLSRRTTGRLKLKGPASRGATPRRWSLRGPPAAARLERPRTARPSRAQPYACKALRSAGTPPAGFVCGGGP